MELYFGLNIVDMECDIAGARCRASMQYSHRNGPHDGLCCGGILLPIFGLSLTALRNTEDHAIQHALSLCGHRVPPHLLHRCDTFKSRVWHSGH
jgi:hypothetical protein